MGKRASIVSIAQFSGNTTTPMATETQAQQSAQSVEWTLQVWRSAANSIATDPQAERRTAYVAAVAEMSVDLPEHFTTQELVTRFWSETLMMSAARASVRSDGRVLNAQVIAAAACWDAFSRVVAAR